MKHESIINIAIAEDHESTRIGIITQLAAMERINVIMHAANGRQLIDQLGKAGVLPDVCLIDIYMPLLDGFKTLDMIRKRWPGIRNLVFTMYEHKHFVQSIILNGANGYVSKSWATARLHTAILQVAGGTNYYPGWTEDGSYYCYEGRQERIMAMVPKESQLMEFVGSKLTYKAIAQKMRIGKRSVETLRDSLFEKFDVHSRQELTKIATELGIRTYGSEIETAVSCPV